MQQLELPKVSSPDILKQGKILIIDDMAANVRLLELILKRAGYVNVSSTTDSRLALELFDSFKPDLLLLDLNMPYVDGFEILKCLKPRQVDRSIPVIVLTADAEPKTKHRALKNGAKDFLTKPFDEVEVLLRMDNILQTHFHSALLEQKVQERTKELLSAQMETLHRLALASDYRDDNTGFHAKRVGRTSGLLAEALGMAGTYVELMTEAAALHDVGKIGISDTILLKPGKLTDEEFATMKLHTSIGASILSGSSSPHLQLAEEIAKYHHEFWDGRGYSGFAGEDIPISGRIVAVADFFDALTHERPYKEPWPVEVAVDAVLERRGTQFDPKVVDAFMSLAHHEIVE